MTITYPNGTVLSAILLSHSETEIRAVAPHSDDVLSFRRVRDIWISEEIEPVVVTFEWQRAKAIQVPSEEDCICSKEFAAHLMQTLCSGPEGGQADTGASDFYVFSREATQVNISLYDLVPV